ncbi:MAG TPA: hypothetical protein VE957_00410 [Terriglobales bacterium]|nr:hypothetical protein [Terriglobales bacterium]
MPSLEEKYHYEQQAEGRGANRETLAPTIDEFQSAAKRNLLRDKPFLAGSEMDELIVSVDSDELPVKGEP